MCKVAAKPAVARVCICTEGVEKMRCFEGEMWKVKVIHSFVFHIPQKAVQMWTSAVIQNYS